MSKTLYIAIIGAGLSGIIAAKTIKDKYGENVQLSIFEKSRGAGGRMSTRRTDAFEFDHGAQYFTARHPDFIKAVDQAVSDGHVAPWDGVAKYLKDGVFEPDTGGQRYVSLPRMNSWVKALGTDFDIVASARVISLSRDKTGHKDWTLGLEGGEKRSGFDYVILAIPAFQAVTLLEPTGFKKLNLIQSARMEPCFAVMVGLDETLELPWDTLRQLDGPASWIAVNSAKPGRPGTETTLMIHAGPEWSQAHVEDDKSDLQAQILQAASDVIGHDITSPKYMTIHRWLYASVSQGLGMECVAEQDLGLIACGDWCLGGRVEGAYLSGLGAAQSLKIT